MAIVTVIDKVNDLVIEKRPFIDGCSYETSHGEVLNKTSPVDGRDLSGLSLCCAEDVDVAVRAANRSFNLGVWADKSLVQKKRVLFKLADLLEDNKEELALLDTVETGRAYKNFYEDSVPKAIEALRYFAEGVDKCHDTAVSPCRDARATLTREPLGVVGLITPWNDPMVVSMWKIAPALLMGNSIVIKPAEQSSFSILVVARLAKEAGIPDGVFNVVTGLGNVAGKALSLHDDVSGVYFTGSSEVGKQILQYSGRSNMKKVGLECGGKSPFIISGKCNNLEHAVKVLARNMFYNQGQICSAPSRAIVDESLLSEFISLMRIELENYIPNNPYDVSTNVGCVVSEEQKDRINQYIDRGIECGATMYVAKPPVNMHVSSLYVLPTMFVVDDNSLLIAQKEIFGPVLTVLHCSNIADAIKIANDSRYGLAASIWSNDLNEVHYVSKALQAGIVHVNCYGDDDNSVPFGGIKESGLGKDKSLYAFDEYCYIKTVWTHFEQAIVNE